MIEDQEIVHEFVEESDEVLEGVVADIMELEKNLDDETVSRVFRAFHSVKGSAHMLGFDRLGKFAHKAEDVLSLVRSRDLEIHKATADLLLHTVDTMRLILNDIQCGADDDRDTDAAMDLLDDTVAMTKQAKAAAPKPIVKAEPKPIVTVESAVAETVPGQDRSSAAKPLSDGDHPQADGPKVAPPMTQYAAPVQVTATGGFVLDLDGKPEEAPAPVQMTPLPPRCEPGDSFGVAVHTITAAKRPLKILIVEDDFICRTVLDTFLSGYGNCEIAKDGMEAIYAFTESYRSDPPQPYDLICMDIMMPIMDGLQASKTIREIERGKGVEGTTLETAIVITSAVEDPATIIRACYECGANYYFVIPLDFNQMKREMQKLRLIT